MKQMLACIALLCLSSAALAAEGQSLRQAPQREIRSEDFTEHSVGLTKTAMAFGDMERSLSVGSMSARTAEGLAVLASSAADYMGAIGGMAFLWEAGCKPMSGKMFLQSQVEFYASQLELRIRQVSLYVAHAPAGVAAAGLELRKQLEEAIRLLRSYRV